MNKRDWFKISTAYDPFIVEWSPTGGSNLRVKRREHEAWLYLTCHKANNAYGYAVTEWKHLMEGG